MRSKRTAVDLRHITIRIKRLWGRITHTDEITAVRSEIDGSEQPKYGMPISEVEADKRLTEWQNSQREKSIVDEVVFSRDGKGADLDRKERALSSSTTTERTTLRH